jgi:hypothetical protein
LADQFSAGANAVARFRICRHSYRNSGGSYMKSTKSMGGGKTTSGISQHKLMAMGKGPAAPKKGSGSSKSK